MLKEKVRKTDEVKDFHFYAFSYYYDLAVMAGLIGKVAFDFISTSMWLIFQFSLSKIFLYFCFRKRRRRDCISQ